MSDVYGYQPPSRPVSVAVRPLNVGMVTSIPSVGAKSESFQIIDGFDVTERGLRRHGGWRPVYREAGASVALPFVLGAPDERVEDMFHMWLSTGDTRSCIVTNRFLYVLDMATGYSPVYWCRNYSVVVYNGAGTDAIITLDTGLVASDALAAGDYVELSTGARYLVKTIDAVNNTITLTGKPVTPPTTFKVLKPFQAFGDVYVDFTIGRYKAYFVDTYSSLVYQYDGTWLSPLVVATTGGVRQVYGARTVAFYKERLYFGNVGEELGEVKQRVRWTEVLDWTKSAAGNYQDLSFRQGPIMKLLGFGDLLVAYTTDAVYYGRQTNMPTLPYAFYLMETAGTAPVGMKAITSFIGGQLFVGADDVYYLAEGPQLTRVGSVVANKALAELANPEVTRLKVDLVNSRVIMALGRASETLSELWLWNYKSKGWSMATQVAFATVAVLAVTDQTYISEVPPTEEFDDGNLGALPMHAFAVKQGILDIYGIDTRGHLLQYQTLAATSLLPTATGDLTAEVYGFLETQDFEFDTPDDDKTILELSLRIGSVGLVRSADVRYRLEASIDYGRTWRHLGVLRITPTDNEDALNFRVTSSVVRFRLTTGLPTYGMPEPYEVVDYTLRVRKRGPENQRSTARG